MPADWVDEYFGRSAPASVYDRVWLVMSLAQLGRSAEAAEYEAEAIRLAEPTRRAYAIGLATAPWERSTCSRATGRRRAHEHLATATTMYREMGMQFWLEQAEAELRRP